MNKTTDELKQIVRPMERGQITIPVAIRERLKITSKTWLWVKLIAGGKIVIEPVEKKATPDLLADYLKSFSSDTKIYWSKKDIENIKKIEKKSFKRLKKFV